MSTPAHLVLIEDNAADVALFEYALDSVGEPYDLKVLRDGEEALRYVQKHWISLSLEPCLIIVDLHLPIWDGLVILEKLRESPALSHVKVAVITTGASPVEQTKLAPLGVALYRQKPTDLDEFLLLGREIFELCQGKTSDVAA